ncbi:MAG: ammonia-forming cytochrome c nitrite reductase subunit c552, partial [Methanosarcinales archaeon]
INKIIKVESLLDEAENFVTSKKAETYNKAKYDLDFVIADRSRGFHNPQKAEKMLEHAESLAKEVIGITENTTHATTSTNKTSEIKNSDVKAGILPGFKAIIAIVVLVVIAVLIMILNKNHRRNRK